MPSAQWREERCASCRYMARAYGAMGNIAEQQSALLRAAAEASGLREPWLDMARFYYAQRDWEGVLFSCRKALAITAQPHSYISESACYGPLPYDLLSIACWRLGLKDAAREALKQALALAPEDKRLQKNFELMQLSE